MIGSFWRSLFSILAAKMVDEFSVEEKFSSFETLEKKIKSFESSSFVQLWKRDCRTVEAAKTRLTKFLNPDLKYYEVKYCCTQGGINFKSRGQDRGKHRK